MYLDAVWLPYESVRLTTSHSNRIFIVDERLRIPKLSDIANTHPIGIPNEDGLERHARSIQTICSLDSAYFGLISSFQMFFVGCLEYPSEIYHP